MILRAMSSAESRAQRRGLLTIVVLAVLTLVEFWAAVGIDSTEVVVVLLSVMALAKAAAIVWYFMHLPIVWRGEEHHP